MPTQVAEANQEHRTEDQAQVAWKGEQELFGAGGGRCDVEYVDHRWVYHIDAVVKHGDDESNNKRHGEFPAVVRPEDAWRAQWVP